ncbi:glycosyltransferase family 4 protein [Mucilaginibacter calamicampi]|uniref:Glycosyltransferase family 4 protein n=1 Tax=Mucilaginibacter calamicampi TaxID=1302352 RepID=A0ABW2YWE3_9SPHI
MKVAILSNDFRVYWRGRLIYLQRYLKDNGVEMRAIELFGKGSAYSFDDYNDKYPWWTCLFPDSDATELSTDTIAKELFNSLNAFNPDVVIASPITFFAGALGLRWAKRNNKKHIMFDDAKPLLQFKRNFLVRWVRDTITAQTDALWLPSADYDMEYPSLDKLDMHFFYGFNCIDNEHFKPSEQRKLDGNTVICVARLVPIKNLHNLLRAWQSIEEKNIQWKLVIIGDGPMYEKLTQFALQLNLKSVNFMGASNYEDMPEHLHMADVFILPSLSETWGLVVNEAMAAGLPVILSNKVNAAVSLLQEGVNGYSFDPYQISDITSSLLKFITLDDDSKQVMGIQSQQIISRMDYNNMGQSLLGGLNTVLKRKVKKTNFISSLLLNLWSGKHDLSAWYEL